IALLVITFSGQSIAYYVTTTWLPSYLADTIGLASASAGATASLFQISALLGAFGVPLLAARSKAWTPVAIVARLSLSLPLGLLLVPGAYGLWAITGRIAPGGGFTAIFSILAATLAPPIAGWLNTATSGWTAPLLLVFAATASFAITGLLAARRAGRFRRGGAGAREILDADD